MIESGDIAGLAELYDRFAHALDRKLTDREQARRQFYARLQTLYDREGSATRYEAFRFEMVKRCKEFLKKN